MIGSKLTIKGQTTIPKAVRDQLGIGPGDRLVFVHKEGQIVLQGLKETLTDLRGRVKAKQQSEDFNRVRQKVKHRRAQKVARG